MTSIRYWRSLGGAILGIAVVGVTGCQTNIAGMTLPSPHYLDHPPQYIPPTPDFPLRREMAEMEKMYGKEGDKNGAAAPPPPPAPVPQPAAQPPAPPPPAAAIPAPPKDEKEK